MFRTGAQFLVGAGGERNDEYGCHNYWFFGANNNLPREMMVEIFGFCNGIEILIFNSKVCKSWRMLSFSLISDQFSDLIEKFKVDLLKDSDRNKLIKYLIRMEVYKIAVQLYSQHNNNIMEDSSLLESLFERNLEDLTRYFPQFHDLKQKTIQLEIPSQNQQETINSNQWSSFFSQFIPKFLFPSPNNSVTQEYEENLDHVKSKSNPIMKVILKGSLLSGKTSFFNCVTRQRPAAVGGSIRNSILADFGTVSIELRPSNTQITAQLWDEHRFSIKPLDYSETFAILLVIDPLEVKSVKQLNEIMEPILENSHSVIEIITIQTKKDLRHVRKLSEQVFEQLAFTKFGGGLSMNITNTKIEEPTVILWYCALLNYLMQ